MGIRKALQVSPQGCNSFYLGKISDLEEEIKADYEKLEDTKKEIDAEIDKLEDPYEQLILRYRYLMFMPMNQIATKGGSRFLVPENFSSKLGEETLVDNSL